MRTECLQFLVQSKAGRLSRDFEQHAAGITEINGMKVRAINYWRDVVAKIDEMRAPSELFRLILRSKRNVMHSTGRHAAHRGIGLTQQVRHSSGRRAGRGSKRKP